jgi:hypothetical protein
VALDAGEDSSAKFKALWGLYHYSMTSGRLSEAAAHADELLGLAQRLGADDLVLEGHHAKWATSLWCGELAAADVHSQKGISRYDCTRHHTLAFTFSGHDPGVCAHSIRAINMALLGFPQQAMKLGAEAVTLARSLSHPYSLALAMWLCAIVLQVGRPEAKLPRSCDGAAQAIARARLSDDARRWKVLLGVGDSGWRRTRAGNRFDGRGSRALFGCPPSH